MKTRSQPKTAPAATVTTSSPAPKSVVRRPSRKSNLSSNGHESRASSNSDDSQVITSLDETVSVTTSPQDEEIASRAYQIWQENGCQDGCDEENWHQARRELSTSVPIG